MEISNSTVKTPEEEPETPTRIQAGKQSPYRNGVLKRLHHPVVISYKECLKNHAAALGGHAVDGCGEFMPSPAANPADPTSLKCAACGCHRNFHRREPEDPVAASEAVPALEYRPHHRHHPPPPPQLENSGGSPIDSPSPPPISSSYYPSAPHMLMALSHGISAPVSDGGAPISSAINVGSAGLTSSSSRKRSRTKFSQDQKQKMLEFAEKLGWRMQKSDQDTINEFCSELGVDRCVFKVWMHNNKHNFCKRDPLLNSSSTTTPLSCSAMDAVDRSYQQPQHEVSNESKENVLHLHLDSNRFHTFGTNGSSSS